MKPLVDTQHAMEPFAGKPENIAAVLVSAFPQGPSCLCALEHERSLQKTVFFSKFIGSGWKQSQLFSSPRGKCRTGLAPGGSRGNLLRCAPLRNSPLRSRNNSSRCINISRTITKIKYFCFYISIVTESRELEKLNVCSYTCIDGG